MKNVIMGVVANYRWPLVAPFFLSYKEFFGNSCDCVIFYDNLSAFTLKKLSQLNVITIQIPKPVSECKTVDKLTPNDWRYCLYWKFLKKNLDQYDQVLLTDVRDVIFQGNVFENREAYTASYLGMASESPLVTIGKQKANAEWIKMGYGEDRLAEIKDEIIICSGTILGDCKTLMTLCDRITKEITEGRVNPFPICDQAILNHLFYSHQLDDLADQIEIFSAETSDTIITIGTGSKPAVKDHVLYNINDIKPKIIHQYDRYDDIARCIYKKYIDVASDLQEIGVSQCGRKIALYGYGGDCRRYMPLLSSREKLQCVFVTKVSEASRDINLVTFSKETYRQQGRPFILIMSSKFHVEIAEILQEAGLIECVDYMDFFKEV